MRPYERGTNQNLTAAFSMNLVSYSGPLPADFSRHDGGLTQISNVRTSLVLRADRENPSPQNGDGWTYNHAPMLAHFAGRFWISWLSSPRDEHAAPCRTLLSNSENGESWAAPRELFPPFPDESQRVIMHGRCGFYLARNGVFLALGFYGTVSGQDGPPFFDHGIGRVARQIHPDGTLGEIYFVRFNANRPAHIEPQFPFFDRADFAFREACESLLADKIKTLEWWDEELQDAKFFAHFDVAREQNLSAISVFERENGQLIGIGKWGRVIFSDDGGASWENGGVLEGVPTNGAKVWAQKLENEKYVLVFNPTSDNSRRWPLALCTSRDGLQFCDLRCVVGEVPPRRYDGKFKDFGPQYVRGIEAGNAPDGALWLAYSMNKEDIWVARVEI